MSSRRTVLVTAILWVTAVTALCLSLNVLPWIFGSGQTALGEEKF